jgi:hypothetical protein
MAYAIKRRRNAGAPKRRKALAKTRNSKMYARGQRLAAKLIAGRRLNPQRSQKEIRQEIHELVRKHGSKSDVDLLEGEMGVGTPSYEFRKGLASVASDVAGFKPSGSSGRRRSRAAASVDREYARDRKDTEEEFESASAKAMRIRHEKGVSLAEAWAEVKGESKPKRKRKSKSKSSGRRKSRSRARRNPRDFGAEFLFI